MLFIYVCVSRMALEKQLNDQRHRAHRLLYHMKVGCGERCAAVIVVRFSLEPAGLFLFSR